MAVPPINPRLHVVTGKGGTGKTTVAGALAVGLAGRRQRVLLIEVEGRQGLAQLFDTPPLPYAETRLTATRGGEVVGLAVDTEAAMLEYLDLFYSIKRAGSMLRKMGAIDFATTIAPGLRDVLLTGKVKEAVTRTGPSGRPAFDAVVLDAPPTGRIAAFLEATQEVAGLTKMGPIHRQSIGVMELLRSARTAVHIVTLLEEMPVQETLDAAAELRSAGYRIGQVIVNRARPELVGAAAPDAGTLAEGLAAVGLSAELAPGLMVEMLDYGARQQVQTRAAAELSTMGVPLRRLPELAPPVDLGSLFELADALELDAWLGAGPVGA
ncbi:MAG: ArsA-related P-loop ATPase [Jatrophihabitantaceae bacterium]